SPRRNGIRRMTTRVTADSGPDKDSVLITDNYVIVCDGTAYLHHTQIYENGTHVLTIKGVRHPQPTKEA
ncbi:MAG: hypothetical protein ACRCZI_02485, partial [Cetobacterium sp.]